MVCMPDLAPGPERSLAILGGLMGDQTSFYRGMQHRYGDIVRLQAFGQHWHLISHPTQIEYILRKNAENYPKGGIAARMSVLGGAGLLTSDDALWLEHRRLMQPGFHRQRIARLAPIMTAAAQARVESWQTHAVAGHAFVISRELMHLTLQIVWEALFSVDLTAQALIVKRSFDRAIRFLDYWMNGLFPLPLSWPLPRNRRFFAARRVLYDVVDTIIAEHKRAGTQGDDSLLAGLLDARDQETGQGMSDQQVRDQVITLMLAG